MTLKKQWIWGVVPLLLVLFCLPAAAKKAVPENTAQTCQDGEDNDEDGFTDCNDQDCSYMVFCAKEKEPEPEPEPPPPPPPPPVTNENTIETCRDFRDNDSDGFVDCQDQDCSIFAFCLQKSGSTAPGMMPGTAVKAEPRQSRGGIGFYPTLVVYGYEKVIYDQKGTDVDPKTDAKNEFTGGIGFFGEFLVAPSVALGGEVILVFPKIDEIKIIDPMSGTVDWMSCSPCERDFHFNLMFRLKFPFKVGRWVGLYPLITVGLSNLTHRVEHTDARNFMGLGYSTGLGVEFYTPIVITPFIEMRYHGALGFRADMEEAEERAYEKQMSIYHSIAINMGIKIL